MFYKALVWIGAAIMVVTVGILITWLLVSGLVTFPTLHIGPIDIPYPQIKAEALELLETVILTMLQPVDLMFRMMLITWDQVITFYFP